MNIIAAHPRSHGEATTNHFSPAFSEVTAGRLIISRSGITALGVDGALAEASESPLASPWV